ncbi:DUF4031 domain-containing protein [Mycolicibacterium chlorophenolicum]|uniref:DUF4031 domain-containing protein n=1 Tax=Mycolicibacterium chlorophenolicum TaxID=37916 RepID=A0A0J6WLQ1_9MYCO|nr:DUF4031 domain-containing protein [Mycolicibacterium chlorophenolicum]KMO82652.1 hypothetical protein MCHLDSM_01275 [Mycolicibacterium chlorophenolicum]
MTVYVDNMRLSAQVGTISGRWSHLMADSDDELDEFAAKLGLKKAWAQHPGTALSHYDVTESKRQQAIALGAVPIDYGGDISIALIRRESAASLVAQQLTLALDADEVAEASISEGHP